MDKYSSIIPENIIQWLKATYSDSVYCLTRYWREFFKIIERSEINNISLVPIKGIALLSNIYAIKQARPMRDIDIICQKKDIGSMENVLIDLGYKKELKGVE